MKYIALDSQNFYQDGVYIFNTKEECIEWYLENHELSEETVQELRENNTVELGDEWLTIQEIK
jgi:hypothetical protein